MKHLFTILLLFPHLLSAQCFASFEVFAGAGFSNTPTTISGQSLSHRPVTVGRVGFGASFHIGKQLHLRTGIQLSQYGEQLDGFALRWGTQSDSDGGFDPDTPSGEPLVVWRKHRNYLEGLLALRYDVKKRGKLLPFVEGGFALGIYGLTRTVSKQETTTRHDDNIRDLSPIARLGFGANYQLNKKFALFAMPVGQYHLQSPDKYGNTQAWQVALEVGVRVFTAP